MLTKKDYKDIAEIISRHIEVSTDNKLVYIQPLGLIYSLMVWFKNDNTRFDESRFMSYIKELVASKGISSLVN